MEVAVDLVKGGTVAERKGRRIGKVMCSVAKLYLMALVGYIGERAFVRT
jgi:hypothetical protein